MKLPDYKTIKKRVLTAIFYNMPSQFTKHNVNLYVVPVKSRYGGISYTSIYSDKLNGLINSIYSKHSNKITLTPISLVSTGTLSHYSFNLDETSLFRKDFINELIKELSIIIQSYNEKFKQVEDYDKIIQLYCSDKESYELALMLLNGRLNLSDIHRYIFVKAMLEYLNNPVIDKCQVVERFNTNPKTRQLGYNDHIVSLWVINEFNSKINKTFQFDLLTL